MHGATMTQHASHAGKIGSFVPGTVPGARDKEGPRWRRNDEHARRSASETSFFSFGRFHAIPAAFGGSLETDRRSGDGRGRTKTKMEPIVGARTL
jgi:hypothetical protein